MSSLKEIADRAHLTARAKGWWREQEALNVRDGEPRALEQDLVIASIPEKLCLIHSEVSEALEDYRVGKLDTTARESDGKPEGFATELADIVIRVMDLAGALGIDLEAEIKRKMDFNDTRSYRHGGKVA